MFQPQAIIRQKWTMSDQPATTSPQPASVISGKLLTVGLLVVLLTTGGLFYWFTTSYANYNAARRQTERAWRTLVVELDLRYRQWDIAVARGVDANAIDMRLGERWRTARDRFMGTALPAIQIPAAQAIEQLIDEIPDQITSDGPPDRSKAVELSEDYAQSASQQYDTGKSTGSRMLKLILNLPDPPTFELSKR